MKKSEQTKKRIADAYLDLIPYKKWDKISVKEICARTDITRGTFYQYYNDIYDLMEQLETSLLEDITAKYQAFPPSHLESLCTHKFMETFDYAPPQMFLAWFHFCRENKKAMLALLDRKHGDHYFIKKLKMVLSRQIDKMMDYDGHPHDQLRTHFVKIFLELHFLSAQTWLESDEDQYLTETEIVNLLNTMRVGSCFLAYKHFSDPEFDQKMEIPE